jgi:hypothetical protein
MSGTHAMRRGKMKTRQCFWCKNGIGANEVAVSTVKWEEAILWHAQCWRVAEKIRVTEVLQIHKIQKKGM